MSTLITKDRLDSIIQLYKTVYDVGGKAAEIGVYKGGSLRVIAEADPHRMVFGFDTFEGLPAEHYSEGEPHKVGDFSDTSLEAVEKYLSDLKNVVLIKGTFPKSSEWMHDFKFAFVHIDTDFYLAVKESLEWFWPHMSSGGIIVFDDYEWGNCPGVKRALEEFGQPIHKSAAYQAYIIKP